nr:DNA ligase 1-like [Ipomoea batatas]
MAAEETRLVFPLFNTDLLLTDRPPVKHVYAATRDENLVETAAASSSGDDAVAGPCCEWSAAAKKSNSTGFSKLWRFRDLAHRSNSDGRDAFVFLNAAEKKIAAGGVKVNAGGVAGEINNSITKELVLFVFAMADMEVILEQIFGETSQENAESPPMQDAGIWVEYA